jgi:hypothetical protein
MQVGCIVDVAKEHSASIFRVELNSVSERSNRHIMGKGAIAHSGSVGIVNEEL